MSDFSVSVKSQFSGILHIGIISALMLIVAFGSIPFPYVLMIYAGLLLAFAISIYEILQNYGIYVEWKKVDD